MYVDDDKCAAFSKMCTDFGMEMSLNEKNTKLAIIPALDETDEETEVAEGLYIHGSSLQFGI